jgi:hypothetical protein
MKKAFGAESVENASVIIKNIIKKMEFETRKKLEMKKRKKKLQANVAFAKKANDHVNPLILHLWVLMAFKSWKTFTIKKNDGDLSVTSS